MPVTIHRRVPELDAFRVLQSLELTPFKEVVKLTARAWVTTSGFGYSLRDSSDHTRVVAFSVQNLTSRIHIWCGFEADFDRESHVPLLGVTNVTFFESSYLYRDMDLVAKAILAWIYESRLLNFTTGEKPPAPPKPTKQEPLPVPVLGDVDVTDIPQPQEAPVFPINWVAKREERNYAIGGRRVRDNRILQILELAEEDVVAHEVIQEWFFTNRSAKETVRRLQRIFRYGWSIHVVPHEGGPDLRIYFRTPGGKKLIDLKLVISADHAKRLRREWMSPKKDGDYNPDAYAYQLSIQDADGKQKFVGEGQWLNSHITGKYYSYEAAIKLQEANKNLKLHKRERSQIVGGLIIQPGTATLELVTKEIKNV